MSILIKNVIFNGKRRDLFIRNNKIEKIARVLNLTADEKIDGKTEKAVLPGLINCHCHSAMVLLRGYADDLSLSEWLEKKIWPLEQRLNKEDIYWGTKLAILEMIKGGTTCFNEMYWSEEILVEAAEEMGIRAVIGLVFLDGSPLGGTEKIDKHLRIFKKRNLKTVEFSIAPHSIYTVSKKNLIWAKKIAQRNNLLLHIHLSETSGEVEYSLKKYKLRPVEYLEKIGFLNESCILAHSIWLSDKEIEILKKRKSSIVYCPCSNMKLSSGIFPYPKMKKERLNVCLGTDGAASNNNLDLFEEMKFASLLQKVSHGDPRVLKAKEVFDLGTLNGAKALRINAGRIQKGSLADLILVDLNNICLAPGHNLISDLVYSCSAACVSDVICNGRILMRDRKIEGEERIRKEATKRARILTSRKK